MRSREQRVLDVSIAASIATTMLLIGVVFSIATGNWGWLGIVAAVIGLGVVAFAFLGALIAGYRWLFGRLWGDGRD